MSTTYVYKYLIIHTVPWPIALLFRIRIWLHGTKSPCGNSLAKSLCSGTSDEIKEVLLSRG